MFLFHVKTHKFAIMSVFKKFKVRVQTLVFSPDLLGCWLYVWICFVYCCFIVKSVLYIFSNLTC